MVLVNLLELDFESKKFVRDREKDIPRFRHCSLRPQFSLVARQQKWLGQERVSGETIDLSRHIGS